METRKRSMRSSQSSSKSESESRTISFTPSSEEQRQFILSEAYLNLIMSPRGEGKSFLPETPCLQYDGRIVVAQADLDRYDAKQAKPSASAKRGLRAAFVYLPLTELHRHASRMYGLTVTDYETSAALIDVMVELHFSDANGEVVPPPILKTSTTDERDTLLSSPPAWKPEWSTEETDKVPA